MKKEFTNKEIALGVGYFHLLCIGIALILTPIFMWVTGEHKGSLTFISSPMFVYSIYILFLSLGLFCLIIATKNFKLIYSFYLNISNIKIVNEVVSEVVSEDINKKLK